MAAGNLLTGPQETEIGGPVRAPRTPDGDSGAPAPGAAPKPIQAAKPTAPPAPAPVSASPKAAPAAAAAPPASTPQDILPATTPPAAPQPAPVAAPANPAQAAVQAQNKADAAAAAAAAATKSGTAPPVYTPVAGTTPADGDPTVAGQLHDILAAGSPLLKQAEGNAIVQMNARGLQNSSLATQAADQAVISQALPIAQADAAYFAQSKLLGQQLANALQLDSAQQQNWLQQNQQTLRSTLKSIRAQADAQAKAQAGVNSAQDSFQLQQSYLEQAAASQQALISAIATIGSTQGLTPQQQKAAVQQLQSQFAADQAALSAYYMSSPMWDSAWGNPDSSTSGLANGKLPAAGSGVSFPSTPPVLQPGG